MGRVSRPNGFVFVGQWLLKCESPVQHCAGQISLRWSNQHASPLPTNPRFCNAFANRPRTGSRAARKLFKRVAQFASGGFSKNVPLAKSLVFYEPVPARTWRFGIRQFEANAARFVKKRSTALRPARWLGPAHHHQQGPPNQAGCWGEGHPPGAAVSGPTQTGLRRFCARV